MPISEIIQLLLLLATSVLFAGAFLLGLMHMRSAGDAVGAARSAGAGALPHEASMGLPARVAVSTGVVMGLVLLAWRAGTHRTLALPVSDPFDAFLVLGLLLAVAVIYFRWTRHLRSLSFFLLPMIAALLVLGLVLYLAHPGENHFYHNAWNLLHILTIVASTALLAMACVGAVVYLLADRQLRKKGLDASHRWIGLPPLASIEKFVRHTLYWGFPVLTIAMVSGMLQIIAGMAPDAGRFGQWSEALKIGCGVASWLVYGVVVQVPLLNPRFRGRRAAWLAVAGFILFLGAFTAARWG